MSSIQELRRQVSQLEQQAAMDRINVSKACEDLIEYCVTHQKHDILVTGISMSDNPFRESKTCSIF
ncbi:guanine nucleotide-binding protein G(I)/G(S)/G(O) subunit gamma-12-like protein [Dinothrombium tinctorium]|uniref:Guanine nucleotide-binding protein subunit gamma n=1 Tax=Dinothrombium tinctorium TaxID=1965070 RepID=A0A443RLV2_9ACAR|nr:guanine nucleotide-binding protein G(I)/G(S)/G(O) subunit gamma-12-like protein [Dinothrombium tinctorium]